MVFNYLQKNSYLPANVTPEMAQAMDVGLIVYIANRPWYPVKGTYARPLSAAAAFYAYGMMA